MRTDQQGLAAGLPPDAQEIRSPMLSIASATIRSALAWKIRQPARRDDDMAGHQLRADACLIAPSGVASANLRVSANSCGTVNDAVALLS